MTALASLFIALSLFGPSQELKDLRANVAGQAAQLASQSATIAILQAQLGAERVQLPTLKADARESREGMQAATATQAAMLLFARDQTARSHAHAETIEENRHQETMIMRLLVIVSIATLITLSIVLVMLWKRR